MAFVPQGDKKSLQKLLSMMEFALSVARKSPWGMNLWWRSPWA